MSSKKQSLAVLLALCSPWLPAGAWAQQVTQAIELQSQFVDISGPNAGNSAGILSRDMLGAILKTFNDPVTSTIRPYNGALALGNAVAWYTNVIAIGGNAAAGQNGAAGSVAIGHNAIADTLEPTFAGVGGQIAIGPGSAARRDVAIAIGNSAGADGRRSIAIGPEATAVAANSISLGNQAYSYSAATDAITIGNSARNFSPTSVALGSEAEVGADSNSSVAIGSTARVTQSSASSVALGNFAKVSYSTDAISIGFEAQVLFGNRAIAIGSRAQANLDSAISIGYGATSVGLNNIALGHLASAEFGSSSIAIGDRATARGVGATAIGAGATTTRDNQLVLGTASTEVTAPNLAGSGNEIVYSESESTLRRGVGIGVNNGSLSVANNFTVGGSTTLSGPVTLSNTLTLSNYKNPQNPGTTEVLSTDANGNLQFTVLPTGALTFCNRTGLASSCYGPNAEAVGEFDTAIGANSKANAPDGATALGAFTTAEGNGSTALGVISNAKGDGSIALGFNAKTTAEAGTAIGFGATADGFNAQAFGTGAIANGRNVIAIGTGAQALGFNTNGLAIGTNAFADGTDVTAVGAGARATGVRSTAIGAGATTTRDNQLVLGTANTEVTAPNLAGSGNAIVEATGDGTLRRSGASVSQITNSIESVGVAVQTAGAMGAALSSVPEVSLAVDEPMRCGIGTGGWGSQYAIAGGCAVRLADRLHLNGAIAYAPSVDYSFGSTPSIAGRLGFSFPLGKINNGSTSNKPQESSQDQRRIQESISSLQRDVQARDQRIEALKVQLDQLTSHRLAPADAATTDRVNALIATLKTRIEQLEKEKLQADTSNQRLHTELESHERKIKDLESRLSAQETMFNRAMAQLQSMMTRVPVELGPTSMKGQ